MASKFAASHFSRGVREPNVRLLTSVIIEYVGQLGELAGPAREAYRTMFDHFLGIVRER